MFAQQNVSIERSKKDEPLTEYDPDLIGLDIGWPQMGTFTATLHQDSCRNKATERYPGEREERIMNHKSRVKMETAQGAK